MRGTLEQLGVAAAVLAVLGVAGLPLTALALPQRWRAWWPAMLPIAGFVSLMCAVSVLNTVAPVAELRFPVAGLLVVGAGIAVWRRPRPIPRPDWTVCAALAVALAAGLVTYSPSLDSGRPTPPAIVSADAFYYAVTATWVTGHTSGAAPPSPLADSFFTPAWVSSVAPLSLGAEQVDATLAAILGLDPATTLGAYVAILAGLACLAVSLLLLAFGLPPWVAVAATVLVAARAEGLRLAFDAAIAQLCGAVILPVVLAATWRWIAEGTRAWLVWAVLALAALGAAYPGYLPFAGITLVVATGVALLAGARVGAEGTRGSILLRAMAAAAGALVLSAPHLERTVDALINVNSVAQLGTLGGFGSVGAGVAQAMGSGHVYGSVGVLAAIVAATAVGGVVVGLVALWRRGHGAIVVGVVVAIVVYLVQLRVLDPYPHGLRKFYDLAGPLLVGALCAGLALGGTRTRVALGAVAATLAVAGIAQQPGLVDRALSSEHSPLPAETDLRADTQLLPDGRAAVALAGTANTGVPMGRIHWALYALETGQGVPTSYDSHASYLMTSAYGNPRVYLPQTGEERYSPNYRYVLSYGPSLAHDDPYRRIGPYVAYRRRPADLMLNRAWTLTQPAAGGRRVQWWTPADGPPAMRVSLLEPATVVVSLTLVTPEARRIRVTVNGRTAARATLGPEPVVVRTRPTPLPAGRNAIEVVLEGEPTVPGPELGLLRARASAVR